MEIKNSVSKNKFPILFFNWLIVGSFRILKWEFQLAFYIILGFDSFNGCHINEKYEMKGALFNDKFRSYPNILSQPWRD